MNPVEKMETEVPHVVTSEASTELPAHPVVVVPESPVESVPAVQPVVEMVASAVPTPVEPPAVTSPVIEVKDSATRLVGTGFWRPAPMINRTRTQAYVYTLRGLPNMFLITSQRLTPSPDNPEEGTPEIDPVKLHGSLLVAKTRMSEFVTSPVLV